VKTKYSRRSILTGGAVALIGTTMAGRTKAQTQKPDSVKTPAGDPKSAQGSAIKTRTASCNCGQLRVTCTGPDPDRVVMCNCYLCQKQTGSVFSVQARFPNEQVKIEGKSTAWKFPIEGAKPTAYRTCAGSDGIATNSAADVVTSHFCPVCGSTVYYFRKSDPDRTGVRVGAFADPTFPPPMGSGFEEYAHPWTKNISALKMPLGHMQ
jgi:hypothetical protein